MKGEDNFFLRSSSLNDICLYLKQKKAWIHCRKVLDSLCSRSCIVPFVHLICVWLYVNLCFSVNKKLSNIGLPPQNIIEPVPDTIPLPESIPMPGTLTIDWLIIYQGWQEKPTTLAFMVLTTIKNPKQKPTLKIKLFSPSKRLNYYFF